MKDLKTIINDLKPTTSTSIRENHKKVLPVINTGKAFNTDRYHCLDRWWYYTYSDDEPEKIYGIIYVENMPYRSLRARYSNSSFSARMDRMVRDFEIEPFMLFINNRFIPWCEIEIIHDNNDSWLKINNPKYNYYTIKDIKMIILPFKTGCISIESDYRFNLNFNAFCSYINEYAQIKNDKLYINIPEFNTNYIYNHQLLDIGAWAYEQLRLDHLGLLSPDRKSKLRSISVDKFLYNEAGEKTHAFNAIFNMFDTDSYDAGILGELCDLPKSNYKDKALFRFNYDGLLDPEGEVIIYTVNEDYFIDHKTINSSTIYDKYNQFKSEIMRENFIVFKNDMICIDFEFDSGISNNFKIDVTNIRDINQYGNICDQSVEDKLDIYFIYRKDIDANTSNQYHFDNQELIDSISSDYFIDNTNDYGYLNHFYKPLNFEFTDTNTYENNINEAYETILGYNPLLLTELYNKHVVSHCITGYEANKWLDKPFGYDTHRGLKVPRMKYHDHETYVIVFVNGILIETYSKCIVYSNHFMFPVEEDFNTDDNIEIMFFTKCNNNEIDFVYTDKYFNVLNDIDFAVTNEYSNALDFVVDETENEVLYSDDIIFSRFINPTELKIFSTDVTDLVKYKNIPYDLENISFPVYDMNDYFSVKNVSIIDRKVTAVSSNKFIYQRFDVDQPAYKILMDKRFRYCDNQKQYMLFINGRKMPDNTFLITIPKITRPFTNMYLYLTKFVSLGDRVELFYLPYEIADINNLLNVQIQENGYFDANKSVLETPFAKDLYMIFVNGKKIAENQLINVSTNSMRVIKDIKTRTAYTEVFPLYINKYADIKDFINASQSKLDLMINDIITNENLGYKYLNRLFNQYISISDIEDDVTKSNVANIAIINEIVRDFWVFGNHNYHINPFIYDYEMDEFITYDEENDVYILPSMDANQDINILKYDLHHLYLQFMNDMPEYFEYGYTIDSPLFVWEYNTNYFPTNLIEQKFNDINISPIARKYQYTESISSDMTFKVYGRNQTSECETILDIKFANGIYYGLVDEDTLDKKDSDIYSNNLPALLHAITKEVKPTPDLTLVNYIIGNNKYFIYAAPKRLLKDGDKSLVSFYLPDINDKKVIDANRDDKTTPILTNGLFDNTNSLIKLDSYNIELLGEIDYTNDYGYTEPYLVYKTNGFFTRLYEDTGFSIYIKSNNLL